MTIEFNDAESASVKSFAVKKKKKRDKSNYKITYVCKTFTKVSLYSLIELLSFSDRQVQEIYEKYQIDRILCFHNLTDTDSTSLQFVILSDPARM